MSRIIFRTASGAVLMLEENPELSGCVTVTLHSADDALGIGPNDIKAMIQWLRAVEVEE
jgi:hypothetical protein